MKASEFDRTFDAGADVSGQVDWSNAKRPNEQAKRVNVDFPEPGSSLHGCATPSRTSGRSAHRADAGGGFGTEVGE